MASTTLRFSSYAVLGIAFICSMLLAAEVDLVAAIVPTHEKREGFQLDELLLLSTLFSSLLAGIAFLNSCLARSERRGRAAIEQIARIDPLTGIANRRSFFERLERTFAAPADVRPCAVVLIDLDRFKTVNDCNGHAAGDALLVHVARQVSAMVPRGGLAARLGGDEFALLLEGSAAGSDPVRELARAVRQVVAAPLGFRGATLVVGASVGIAVRSAETESATALIEAADSAMYHAKRTGRARTAA